MYTIYAIKVSTRCRGAFHLDAIQDEEKLDGVADTARDSGRLLYTGNNQRGCLSYRPVMVLHATGYGGTTQGAFLPAKFEFLACTGYLVGDNGAVAEVSLVVRSAVVVQHQVPVDPDNTMQAHQKERRGGMCVEDVHATNVPPRDMA